jgi:UDP-N-acetylmuramate dehydrogenase
MMIQRNVPLTDKSTMQTVSTAKYYAEIKSEAELESLLHEIRTSDDKQMLDNIAGSGLHPIILGEGSNMVFPDELCNLVIKNEIKGIEIEDAICEDDSDAILVTAGSGESFENLLAFCLDNDIFGLENLVGIPGTVGAAAAGNIGAYGTTQSDFFYSCRGYDFGAQEYIAANTGSNTAPENTRRITPQFQYRNSNLRGYFLTSVTYKLSRKFTPNFNYDAFRYLDRNITAPELSEHIRKIRDSKLPDYKTEPNAGSYFKNPVVPYESLEEIVNKCGMLKCYPAGEAGKVKLSAAQLIEISGLKGYRTKKCGVSEKHSLILINFGGATGNDIKALEEHIINTVSEETGVVLSPEVKKAE